MARSESQILGSLINERDSSNTHSGVLSDVTEQYRIQNSEYDKTARFADFQTAMEETIKESLLEQQITSLATGQKNDNNNNFEDDELTKFFTEELTELVSDVADMTRDQMKVQKKRIEVLSTSLANSDAKEKDFLMEQFAKSTEFLEQEYDKKNSRLERTTEMMSHMADQYIDIQALYSGFFNHNPLAMLAWKLGGNLWKASKKRAKDEKTLVANDVHKQQMAIKTEEDKQAVVKADAERAKRLKDAETEFGGSVMERNDSADDAIDESNMELNSESNPTFVQNVGEIQNANTEGTVADEIRQGVEEKSDRKKQQAYYQDTKKWQQNLLKCICPNGKSTLLKDGAGFGVGSGSSGKGGSSMADKAMLAGGTGVATALATKAGAIKDSIKSNSMVSGAMDFLKKNKKVSAVVAGGAMYLGMGDDADAKTMPNVPKSITKDPKLSGNHQKDIENQVNSDSFNAVMTDVALSSATMLKVVKAIPVVGSVASAVGDTGLEYAQGGSVGSSATVGAGAMAGAGLGGALGLQIGTALAPFTAGLSIPIASAVGAIGGSIVGAMGTSAMFGDTDEEKKDNLTTRNLDKRGIIDRNDLMPFEDSILLSPDKLKNLSINELKSLLAVDDFSEEDQKLIKETLEIKQGFRTKLSKSVKAHLDESTDNAVLNRVENKEIIDRNSLIPFADAVILKPEELKDLSISQLKTMLQSDDFSDVDLKLIKETIEMKEGVREKYSRDSQSKIDTSVKERKQIVRDDKAESTAEELADQGIVNLDYLGDSEILQPELLKTLPVAQLQQLLDFKDWDEEDTSLIQDTIDKKKTGKKMSQGNQDRVDEASLENLEESGVYEKSMFGKDTLGSAEELNKLDVETLSALKKDGSFDESTGQMLDQMINTKSQEKPVLEPDAKDVPISTETKLERDKKREDIVDPSRNNEQSLTGENKLENATDRQAIDSMLDKIGKAESNNNYDAEWGGGKFGDRGSKKLTEMTMGEVKAYQKEMLNTQKDMGKGAGQRSSALGKYQFISGSMKEAQKMSGLSDDDLYSEENQDKMGEMWLKKRGGMDKFNKSDKNEQDADKFQNKVATQWASMKNTQGRGAYDGDGMNTARHSVRDEINQMVNNQELVNQTETSIAMSQDADKYDRDDVETFMGTADAGTTTVDKLLSDSTSNAEMVARIESTNSEIQKEKDDKQNQPQVIQQISSNSTSSGSGGGGDVGSSAVGGARNNNSSLQRITDRYISSGMS